MSRWFRFYDDALLDPKIRRLGPRLFHAWVGCLCLASKHDGDLGTPDDLAFGLVAMATRRGRDAVAELTRRGLLDEIGGRLTPHGWSHRQYQIDNSKQRVRNFRQRQRELKQELGFTTVKRVTVTPRTEQIDKKEGQQWENPKTNVLKISPELAAKLRKEQGRE